MNNTDLKDGLGRILAKIEADGLEKIRAYDERVDSEIKGRTDEIEKSANEQANEIISKAKNKAARIIENSNGGAAAREKRYVLSAQSKVLDSCIEYGLGQIKNMPTDRYFELIRGLIIKYSQSGTNTLLLSQKDAERLPSGFVDEINKELEKMNAKVILGDEFIQSDAGFVLRKNADIDGLKGSAQYYIEENCTFDAMINDNMDTIRDLLYKKLKAQGVFL